jgi:stalled ribosome alternative rescue factor ArfA
MKKGLTSRSPYAKLLEHQMFHMKVVKAKKGKGSYSRSFFKKVNKNEYYVNNIS